MLEEHNSAQVNELLEKLPCTVRIPSEWSDFFTRRGILPSRQGDARRFARKHMPGKGILEITETLPTIPREQKIFAVYTRDISRIAISFLHFEQLYPGEAGRLWLPTKRACIEVVRCQRVIPRCYIIGAEMMEPASAT